MRVCDKHEIVVTPGELAGKGHSEPARSTGYQSKAFLIHFSPF